MKYAIKLLFLLLCTATIAFAATGCAKNRYFIDGEEVDEDYYLDYIESKENKYDTGDEREDNDDDHKGNNDEDNDNNDRKDDSDEDDDDNDRKDNSDKDDDDNDRKDNSDKDDDDESNLKKTTSKKSESKEKSKFKKRLTQDGVEYLVNNGKLIISGNGTVTKDAISKLLPYYNTVDFEMGTFDVGNDAFNGSGDNITEIILRNNVSVIGERAFKGCNIAFILLGSSITQIGDGAFEDCNCLEEVFINNEYIF